MVGKRWIIILFLIGFILFLANSLINYDMIDEDNKKINNYTIIINYSDSSFRFAVIGDYGLAGENEERVAELVKSWSPDFIITTGDNNYDDGSYETIDENIGRYYHEFIYPYKGEYGEGSDDFNRFFPSLGNHDWGTGNVNAYFDYFELPGNERYYDFKFGNAHFFALDSDEKEPDGTDKNSIQARWLINKLNNSDAKFKAIYFHHAPYSSSSRHGPDKRMQWPFNEWGADVVISGHDHTYERINIDNFTYFVNGLGGNTRYGFRFPIKESMVRYNDDYGAMFVDVNSSSAWFRFINVENGTIDNYVMYF